MNAHFLRNVVVAVAGLLIIGAVWLGLRANRDAMVPAPGATSTDPVATTTPDAGGNVTRVKVALLDYSGEKPGKQRGCDRVILVDRDVAPTSAPLTAALRELFAMTETEVDGLGNFIPRTRATLAFDRAEVTDGTAKVYLIGKLSGLAGVCDDPRTKIQIEETALQFPTVQRVELYLDGVRTELQPSQKGD